MLNDGTKHTDYGALQTDPNLQFSDVSFISASNTQASGSSTTDNNITDTFEITTRDGETQSTALPTGIYNSLAGILAFTIAGLDNGGSTTATLSIPKGLKKLKTDQLAYLRFNYDTNRFEEYLDTNGTPLYSFQDSSGNEKIDSIVLQLNDGDQSWDGDGLANGSIMDPGFLGTGNRAMTGNHKNNTLQGDVLANTLIGKQGRDKLVGDLGNDILIGNANKDRMSGGEGDDILKGKTGHDRLHGGKGDDTLIGGTGSDRFHLSKGNDTIKDFSIEENDQVQSNKSIDLIIEQDGKHLLITDSKNKINTKLLNTPMSELLNHQPDLIS